MKRNAKVPAFASRFVHAIATQWIAIGMLQQSRGLIRVFNVVPALFNALSMLCASNIQKAQ